MKVTPRHRFLRLISATRNPVSWIIILISALPAKAQQEIAFLSDTQAPMWVETLALKRNNNEEATARIFLDIVQRRPSHLFILGDVVKLGYKKKKWTTMDIYLDSCRRAGIKVSALLGNHDVMTRAKKGELQFQHRFPDHNRTGYYLVVDSIAFVFLNSNFKKLGPNDLKKQQDWYTSTLKALDKDATVAATIVACHHAPFTNSKIVGSSENVQKYFVPGYVASAKAKLFITGHSHNYEWFRHGGKDFLVIGGGGGLSQPRASGQDVLEDVAATYKPAFHYILLKRSNHTIGLTSRYLKEDFSGFEEGISFTVAYP